MCRLKAPYEQEYCTIAAIGSFTRNGDGHFQGTEASSMEALARSSKVKDQLSRYREILKTR